MPCYNNRKIPTRTRGKSCPAGVRFQLRNDISNDSGGLRKSNLEKLQKESNFTRQRRQSFPSALCDDEFFGTKNSTHPVLNYSAVAGGEVHNCCKLVGDDALTHSFVDVPNHHTCLNKSTVHDLTGSFPSELPSNNTRDFNATYSAQHLCSCHSELDENEVISEINSLCEKQAVQAEDVNENIFKLLTAAGDTLSNFDETGKHSDNGLRLDNSFLRNLFQERLEDIDSEDSDLFRNTADLKEFLFVDRLESHVYGTELLVENLASKVQETKEEIEMSKRKQENEINDLISLNEEMQTIWSEKESEVREVLERFSAYRDAVEADSKERDEMFTEEINKREMVIKELQDELKRRNEAFQEVVKDVQCFDARQAEQLVDVNQLVACLLETFSDQEASVVCQTVSLKLETSIAKIKEKDYARYINCLNISRQTASSRCEELNISEMGAESTEALKMNYRESKLGKTSFSSSVDEGNGYSILSSSDGERNDSGFTENISGSTLNNELVKPEEFTSEDFTSCLANVAGNDEFYETLEEDFVKLLKEIEESGSDCLINGYVDKKIVVKLLEEQWSKYQFLCKEKDAEVQHWKRKHKQDTKDLQSILEEQEIHEAKSTASLAELQNDMEKLRQRNKFLESEVEFTQEQGEEDVCFLKESFQKNLSAQLRRQSQSFLSAEESTRNQLAELETTNEELRRSNEALRREIAEHCTVIKSWVTDILLLSEEEYNEEFHSITDVLAKLQKIIIENKRRMEVLQEELNEQRGKVNEPSSPPDTLSHSWGGYSWNSGELQKEFCRNCKQVKWQRVLMGSYDLVDAGLAMKQDEVERYVSKLSVDESKYRKKHSLKDSLELADAEVEHLQRLSRQEFGSLETLGEDSLELEACRSNSVDVVLEVGSLGEDSLEGSDGESSVGDDVIDGRRRSEENPAIIAKKTTAENSEENWQNIHVSPRVLNQYSMRSDPEFDDGNQELDLSGDVENHPDEIEMISRNEEEQIAEDKDEQLWIEEDNGRLEEDQDRVHIVNLYRSLIVGNCTPPNDGFPDGGHRLADNERTNGESGDENKFVGGKSDECGDEFVFEKDSVGNKEYDSSHEAVFVGRKLTEQLQNEIVRKPNDKLGDESVDKTPFPEDVNDNLSDDNQAVVPRNIVFSIPKIIVGKDLNENFLETKQEDKKSNTVEEKTFDETSNKVGCVLKTEDSNIDSPGTMNKGLPIDGIDSEGISQPVLTDVSLNENIVKPESMVSESWTISADPKNSMFEFVGNFEDERPTCTHCSETLEEFKEKLIEIISNQRKDNESEIRGELEDAKTELREIQSEYEKLENLCEDYRNYVDEYSGNLRRKNEELRNLKLSSGIMKTEIEWLRHALGITRNYDAESF